ncbi:hypothetical protein TrVE_jg4082 [Triparma verrucosa]|uniref:Uncharacterized protein n=1 Tax=Triparma verrucosa TaxID=1606542 RepID=A0A9W7BJ69_9STRA|nr:hypothetical protein TrVE_jg4082 [Triparma verrucosa]
MEMSFLHVIFLLFCAYVTPSSTQSSAAPPQATYFTSHLNILSPSSEQTYSSPVIPITVRLNPLDTPTVDADKSYDQIHFTLKSDEDGGYTEDLDEDLLEYLLPSVNLKLCFHVKGEQLYFCAKEFVNDVVMTAGSLFRLPEGGHTIFAWAMTVPASDVEKSEYVYSNSCSYEEMETLLCDPFFITEAGNVQAYTSAKFFIEGGEDGTGGGETSEGSERDSGEPVPVLARSAKEPRMNRYTKEDRTKYFDKIYEAEIWSFPDWDGTGGFGVKSGFGSTLHQTVDIRNYLDMIVDSYNIKGVVDVPCGDMNWMPHVKALGRDDFCYFGGDVSKIMIEEQRKKFSHAANMVFDVVDVISEGLLGMDGVGSVLECSRRANGSVLIFMRHLMFHLTMEENLGVLKHIEASSSVNEIEYIMLSTYLRSNDNEDDYLLANGHKINLFEWPYCLEDPLYLVKDGEFDLFMGLWRLEPGKNIRRKRNNMARSCE